MEAANDNFDDIDVIAIPQEHFPEITLYLREHHFPEESVSRVRVMAAPTLRTMKMLEDEVWTMVIEALEWMGTLSQERKQTLMREYNTISLVA